jgi:hypothetical protein|tara:strand:+ start:5360 stop:5662 length:303 start_codon:yes stop_codon:yes gene_type:complete
MKKRSKWVETEVEQGARVFLLPIRCRVETKNGKFRTCIQRRAPNTGTWHSSHTTEWLPIMGSPSITMDFLDIMAQRMADSLVIGLENGPMHPDWEEITNE